MWNCSNAGSLPVLIARSALSISIRQACLTNPRAAAISSLQFTIFNQHEYSVWSQTQKSALWRHMLRRPGGSSERDTPDPIPNSAVKPLSAYGTSSQDAGESVAARSSKHMDERTPSRTNPITPLRAENWPARFLGDAGWSSPVARQAHNLKVAGSNPAPATNANCSPSSLRAGFCHLRRTPRSQDGHLAIEIAGDDVQVFKPKEAGLGGVGDRPHPSYPPQSRRCASGGPAGDALR